MLIRIGLIWGKDELCPAQEHFISNIIRQKIISATDSLPVNTNKEKLWILYLPEGENHEIGLLFANFIIRSAGFKTIYLGSQVPLQSLSEAIHDNHPTDILFFITKKRITTNVQSYLSNLSSFSSRLKIHLSGNKNLIAGLKLTKNMQWIQSVEQLEKTMLKNKQE
jgi:methanogenic corrinoid protein MtbC1